MSPEAPVQDEQPVLVDQRALINKVLARYPRDFTLFRELLQNSDDAGSTIVEIHFKTAATEQENNGSPLLHSKSPNIVQWTFKNNGNPFADKDWYRLTRIAVGNPDPQKVGAFGVGFYSIFSVTDEPSVSSEGHKMEFYWKGDQLYFRKRECPKEDWTVFDIPLRVPTPMLDAVEFMQFLATSITFMVDLNEVRLVLDERYIGCIKKSHRRVGEVELPIALEHTGPLNMVIAGGLRRHQFTIQAEISAELVEHPGKRTSPSQSPPQFHNPSTLLQTTDHGSFYTKELDLTVFTVEVNINLANDLSGGLRRCMNKNPPSPIKYGLVYAERDEHDPTSAGEGNAPLSSVFEGLRANLAGTSHSKIFIGHSTSQTTGFGGHLASHFIPTVERESIDLADRNVAAWNNELLYIGGFLSRSVYELQLSAIQTDWEKAIQPDEVSDSRPPKESLDGLRERFVHVLNFFTFYASTPSPSVSLKLQDSFYRCSKLSLRLLSSVGVRLSSQIRLYDPLCDKFLKHVPMLSPDVAGDFIKALPDGHKIGAITHTDVVEDLDGRTLEEAELVACLQWQIPHGSAGMTDMFQAARFLDAAGADVYLSSIQCFIDPGGPGNHIPADGPLPPSLIPRRITKHFTLEQLAKFGWKEFTIVDWLQYISRSEIRLANPKHDFTLSIDWAEVVLRSISSVWSSASEIRRTATKLFSDVACLPTTCGLRIPKDAFLPSPSIPTSDEDFPIVQLPTGHGISMEVLKALGVQQRLPPHFLIKMLEGGQWKTSNLIEYLVPDANSLSEEDIEVLSSSNSFEGTQRGADKTHFHIKELYPPLDVFGKLHLPLIDLGKGSAWQESSLEATLLYKLGLQHFPPLGVIVELCSDSDDTMTAVRANAFDYLCANLRSVYSECDLDELREAVIIPAENKDKDGLLLEKPANVFLDKEWKVLGYSVVQRGPQESILEELGVQRYPPSALILDKLKENPPSDEAIARSWFETLSNHVSKFTDDELKALTKLPIVPYTISEKRKWLNPAECYLKRDSRNDLYSELFHFVNFSEGACQFLRACGAKDRPSAEDVAKSLTDDHQRFYDLTGESERYLQELRHLAAEQKEISNEIISKMMSTPVLLGARREETLVHPDGWKNMKQYTPQEIIIVDDIQTYQLFAESIIVAPRDMPPELEDFYVLLGCKYLTNVVSEHCDSIIEKEAAMRSEIQDLVSRRLPLFLHHSPLPHSRISKPRPQVVNIKDITVKVCEELLVHKILVVGETSYPNQRKVWAIAKREQAGIELWLSCGEKRDMYELAVSLCRALFDRVNLSDSLLLSTILSEDADVLRRRGYEVDQALQSQRCLDAGRIDTKDPARGPNTPATSSHPMTSPTTPPTTTTRNIGSDTRARTTTNQSHSVGSSSGASSDPSAPSSMPFSLAVGMMISVSNNVRDAFSRAVKQSIVSGVGSSDVTTAASWDPCQVMPRAHIESTAKSLIKACGSEQQTLHRDVAGMKALSSGYCKEPMEEMRHLSVGSMDVYVGAGKPLDKLMERKRERLACFNDIITRVASIYGLPAGSWHIFWDRTAGCIAFNCKGTLYLNLRYFEIWHYQDIVKKRDHGQRQALASWFLALAHEIAHNLVAEHNSEHEFWSSAICEAHMDKLTRVLDSPLCEVVTY